MSSNFRSRFTPSMLRAAETASHARSESARLSNRTAAFSLAGSDWPCLDPAVGDASCGMTVSLGALDVYDCRLFPPVRVTTSARGGREAEDGRREPRPVGREPDVALAL